MLRSLLGAALCAAASAQAITVDYPDSTIGANAGQYPIYTGTGLNVIRGQSFCPGTFAGLPTTPMVCTRVGVQLAEVTGPVTYAQFVVRVGSTTVTALTNTWATNLPNQTVQVDLSNQLLHGGSGVNQWVDWPLAAPFLYTPGDGIVLDITSQASVAGQYLRTAIGTGVPRMVSTAYGGGPTGGTPLTSGGIKFRLVFDTGGFFVSEPGCTGSGSLEPQIGAMGQPTLGNSSFVLTLQNALGGTLCGLLIGFPTHFDIGGGCIVRCDGQALVLLATSGTGPGAGTAAWPFPIPTDTWLTGLVLDSQWGVFDPGSGSPLGIATSSNAKLVLQ